MKRGRCWDISLFMGVFGKKMNNIQQTYQIELDQWERNALLQMIEESPVKGTETMRRLLALAEKLAKTTPLQS